MLTLRRPAPRTSSRVRKLLIDRLPADEASADRVRGALLGIAYALHATRVVGRRAEAPPPKKG
ncbi:MAG: hypothetical protein K2W96_28350 [Gemmataceae bacterium]|nr:hypothetical protein [Gemmataceae bacterium]